MDNQPSRPGDAFRSPTEVLAASSPDYVYRMKRLTEHEIDSLRSQYSHLRPDYFEHLARIGWGQQDNGRILYSGPVHPADVYGESFNDSTLLLLGDDGCGYCFGFDPTSHEYGELTDQGEWTPWLDRAFADYVS